MPDSEKLCFVIMPFKDELKSVYSQAIKPAVIKCGFDCLRVDELKMGPFNIHRKIIEYIYRSKVIVADLSQWNPNVYYEMGVAHSIDNKTLMIVQKGERLPFDISTYHVIQYEPTEAGLVELRQQIQENLAGFEEWRQWPTNPVQDFRPFDAFVPKTELENLKNSMADRDRLLRESVPRQTFEQKVKDLTDANQTLAQKQNYLEKLQANFQDLESRYAQIFREKETLQEQIAQLERDDQTQTLHTLQQQVRELDAAQQKLAAEKEQLETELSAAHTEKARHEKRATELTRQNAYLKQLNTPNSWAHWLMKMNWYGLGAVILIPMILLNLIHYTISNRSPESTDHILNSKIPVSSALTENNKSETINQKTNRTQQFRFESKSLSSDNVKAMLKDLKFFDSDWNENGTGFSNNFIIREFKGEKIIIDMASELMWQKGGSDSSMNYVSALKWLKKLNENGYAGFKDWRFPTLEEAMSLIERKKENNDLYINRKFNNKQRWIWTSDRVKGKSRSWIVIFYQGNCDEDFFNDNYVRLVRSVYSFSGK